MNYGATRRDFVKAAGLVVAGECLLGQTASANEGESPVARERSSADPISLHLGLGEERRCAIEDELKRRAKRYQSETRLLVDYYRIRRKVAYPLPVTSTSIPEFPVPNIPVYPWATWMTWELEERVNSLGWGRELLKEESAEQPVLDDLNALAQWPSYRQYNAPDLCLGHCARILCRAHRNWSWIGDEVKARIESACARIVDDVTPLFEKQYGAYPTAASVLKSAKPHHVVRNIPVIGSIGLALAANTIGDASSDVLNKHVAALLKAIWALRKDGVTEGVAYNGYVLDFAADWLEVLPKRERDALLDFPHVDEFLEESYMLGAPGEAARVAEHSDVEPEEMPFHLSAQAKLQRMKPDAVRNWHFTRCRIDWLRSECLAFLHLESHDTNVSEPSAGALDAHYAAVLRTGWESDDVAAVISTSRSPMSHIQRDGGSLVLGTGGEWLISDPGYQQYMKDQERDFTLGVAAHNAPVINGNAQVNKATGVVELGSDDDGLLRNVVNLTKNYDAQLALDSVVRTTCLVRKDGLVVADCIQGEDVKTVAYHWHGHPDAAWWTEDGWVFLQSNAATLRFGSPQASITTAEIDRLPGSRGQLTVTVNFETPPGVIWWVFALGDSVPELSLSSDGKELTVWEKRILAAGV